MISILAGAAIVFVGAWGLGRALWRWQPPHWTYAVACGAPLLSLAVFFCLLFGFVSPLTLVLLCAAAGATGLPGLGRPAFSRPPWLALVFLPFVVLYAVNALAPPTQPDAVTYHLGLVAEWLRLHGFAPRIGFYEMLPLGLETLFAPAVAVGGYPAAAVFHALLLAATVPLLMRAGTLLGLGRESAAGAAALYALAPVVGISGTTAYNDAAGVYFCVAVFTLLVEDWHEPSDRLLAMAGLAAGFCLAIKITGLLVVAGALGWLAWRRRWRGAALLLAAALVSILPWTLRDLRLTGNPIAPLGNHLFPNDYFHAALEDSLGTFLRDYGVTWREVPWQLTVDGLKLQGLFGPVFLLLPLALLALRKPAGRAVLAVAALLVLPWTQNLGARFLMPALPFFALAFALALPRGALAVLVILHAISAWPTVTQRYAATWGWRLKEIPFDAAFGPGTHQAYLTEHLSEYPFLQKAAARLKPNEPILDLYALPYAYLNTVPAGPLPSASVDNMTDLLAGNSTRLPELLYPQHAAWPLEFVRAVRLRLEEPIPAVWSISEVTLERNGRPVPISRHWFLNAAPVPGDAWLAVDGNVATRWQSWVRSGKGMYWELRFDRPIPLDGLRARMINISHPAQVAIEIQRLDRSWRRVPGAVGEPEANFYRAATTRFVKQQGYSYIAVRIGGPGQGPVGASMAAFADAWGVDLVARDGDLGLFRIR